LVQFCVYLFVESIYPLTLQKGKQNVLWFHFVVYGPENNIGPSEKV